MEEFAPTSENERPAAPEAPGTLRRSAPARDYAWVWQVTALSLALGLMLALAIRTTERIRNSGLPSNRYGASAADLSRYQEQNEKLRREIEQLRQNLEEYQTNARLGRSSSRQLQKQLLEYKALMGYGAVRGRGLKITLRDSPLDVLPGFSRSDYQIADRDISALVNELWAAGAEAIALAGAGGGPPERFVLRTTVTHPPGNTRQVVVNGRVLSPPYTLLAIGSPKDLRKALEMPEGIIQNLGLEVLQMIKVEESRDLVLPAYRSSGPDRVAAAAGE